MQGSLIATTTTEGLKPLGSAAQRSFDLLTHALRERLGEDHAALFAEPVPAESGNAIDWHLPGRSRAMPLSGLPAERQEPVLAELERLSAGIRTLAAELAEGAPPDRLLLAEALENALTYPDATAIYAVAQPEGGDRPLLISWAWAREGQAPVLAGLSARVAARPPAGTGAEAAAPPSPPMAVVAPAPRRGGWLWLLLLGWLLLAAMIGAIFWLVLPPCGIARPFLASSCPVPEPPERGAEQAALRDEIAALDRALRAEASACRIGAEPPPPVPALPVLPVSPAAAPPPEGLDDLERATRETGLRVGKLTFTLMWDGQDDLDLKVSCPAGVALDFTERVGCGGNLDRDSIPTHGDQPVENILFDNPQPGDYRVEVRLYSQNDPAPRPFRLWVREEGQPERSYDGSLSRSKEIWAQTMTYR